MDHTSCRTSMYEMLFVSMGMLIIDDVFYSDSRPPMMDVVGGAGTYATVGARLFHNATIAIGSPGKHVGFVVHAGSDFPQDIRTEIEGWNSGTTIIETPERLTTRGKNVYRNGIRDFKFSNLKMQVEPRMLSDQMKLSKTYHLICDPVRCTQLVKGILAERQAVLEPLYNPQGIAMERDSSLSKPIFVWEPMEGSCRPKELQSFYEALKYVDIFSPNENELASLFNQSQNAENVSLPKELLVHDCEQLLALGFDNKPCAVVVRMGAAGCLVATTNRFIQFPAYHTPPTNALEELDKWQNKMTKTFDVTGGGNAFMGGFCVGLTSQMDDQIKNHGFNEFEIAAIYGTVSASFAIEQAGVPKLTYRPEDGKELWNGEQVEERFQKMMRICAEPIPPPDLSEGGIRKGSRSVFGITTPASETKPQIVFYE